MTRNPNRAFRWVKRGRIFRPDGRYEWMQTHAQNPAVLPLGDRLRVYFNCRPKRSADGSVAARPAFVDLNRANPGNVVAVADRPILDFGGIGTFDQFGVMSGSVVRSGSEIWLYYVGWMRCLGVPYDHSIGLAVSRDEGTTFERTGRGPIVTRTPEEPFVQNSPYVAEFGGVYHMWYSTGTKWIQHGAAVESIYVLVHATSTDGRNWERDGVPCVETILEEECQTNPCVVELDGRFHMWFCYRCGVEFRNADRGYRIGYAWSDDLRTWHRDDELGRLLPSDDGGWDSEMVCYPCILEVDGRLLMFYSGNDFGREGFGYAELIAGDAAT